VSFDAVVLARTVIFILFIPRTCDHTYILVGTFVLLVRRSERRAPEAVPEPGTRDSCALATDRTKFSQHVLSRNGCERGMMAGVGWFSASVGGSYKLIGLYWVHCCGANSSIKAVSTHGSASPRCAKPKLQATNLSVGNHWQAPAVEYSAESAT
jgi:hypothetical protein